MDREKLISTTDDKSKTNNTEGREDLDISQIITDENLPENSDKMTDLDIINDQGAKSNSDTDNSNVFGMLTGFLRKTVWSEKSDPSLNVLDDQFWPHIMDKCIDEWSSLKTMPGITKLLHNFD